MALLGNPMALLSCIHRRHTLSFFCLDRNDCQEWSLVCAEVPVLGLGEVCAGLGRLCWAGSPVARQRLWSCLALFCCCLPWGSQSVVRATHDARSKWSRWLMETSVGSRVAVFCLYSAASPLARKHWWSSLATCCCLHWGSQSVVQGTPDSKSNLSRGLLENSVVRATHDSRSKWSR